MIRAIITKIRSLDGTGNAYIKGKSNDAALAQRLAANAGIYLPIKGIPMTAEIETTHSWSDPDQVTATAAQPVATNYANSNDSNDVNARSDMRQEH